MGLEKGLRFCEKNLLGSCSCTFYEAKTKQTPKPLRKKDLLYKIK